MKTTKPQSPWKVFQKEMESALLNDRDTPDQDSQTTAEPPKPQKPIGGAQAPLCESQV